jgi:hypothetical protein
MQVLYGDIMDDLVISAVKGRVNVAKNNHSLCHSSRKYTACCSAPDVKARAGKASIINFKELPEGIAGVIPMIFRFSG